MAHRLTFGTSFSTKQICWTIHSRAATIWSVLYNYIPQLMGVCSIVAPACSTVPVDTTRHISGTGYQQGMGRAVQKMTTTTEKKQSCSRRQTHQPVAQPQVIPAKPPARQPSLSQHAKLNQRPVNQVSPVNCRCALMPTWSP